jgi:hypothetical protein
LELRLAETMLLRPSQFEVNAATENTTTWQSLNRSGGSLFFLTILFAISVFLHFMARGKIDLVALDDRAAGEARLIDFVHGHLWIPPLYFAFLVAVWFRLSVANAGKVPMFAALLLLSTPVLFYDRACLHINFKLLSVQPLERPK